MKEKSVPRCGAKKQNGKPCRNRPLKDTKRCSVHSGKKPKARPQLKNESKPKHLYLPAGLAARVETLASDAISNLEQSIRIQVVLETQLHEKLGTGESGEAWKKLKAAISDYERAAQMTDTNKSADGQAKAFTAIKLIVNHGLAESLLLRDIQAIHETQRKLTETLTKCRKEIQETYTAEQWNMFLEVVVRIIRNNVDTSQLDNIRNAIFSASRDQDKPRLPGPGS